MNIIKTVSFQQARIFRTLCINIHLTFDFSNEYVHKYTSTKKIY